MYYIDEWMFRLKIIGSMFEDSERYGGRRVLGKLIIKMDSDQAGSEYCQMMDYCVGNAKLYSSSEVTCFFDSLLNRRLHFGHQISNVAFK